MWLPEFSKNHIILYYYIYPSKGTMLFIGDSIPEI